MIESPSNENRPDPLSNTIQGVFLGTFIGITVGFGATFYLAGDPFFFTGDIILTCALLFGMLGYFLGEGFIEWVKEWYLG